MKKSPLVAKIAIWTILVFATMIGISLAVQLEQTEFLIDVVEDEFICDVHVFPLSPEIEKPISVGIVAGEIWVAIQTEEEMLEINLGPGRLALTERALPYVEPMEVAVIDEYEEYEEFEGVKCELCGRSKTFGRHYIMDCGHIGCKVSLDHPQECPFCFEYKCNGQNHEVCTYCKKAWCVHDNLKCPYSRNPAPTPFETSDPAGESKTHYKSNDGKFLLGPPEGQNTSVWIPGDDFYESHTMPPWLMEDEDVEK